MHGLACGRAGFCCLCTSPNLYGSERSRQAVQLHVGDWFEACWLSRHDVVPSSSPCRPAASGWMVTGQQAVLASL